MSRTSKNHDVSAAPEAAGAPAAGETVPVAEVVVEPAPAKAPAAPQPDQVSALKAEVEDYKNKYLRLLADMDNARKRHGIEKLEYVKHANQNLISKLLPIVDSFELALQHAEPATETPAGKALVDGLKMTVTQIHNLLRESGVEAVDALGQPFDPRWHEAVSQMDSEEHPAGNVMHQLRKGYRLHERLLRPATVIVSKGKPSGATGDTEAKAAD